MTSGETGGPEVRVNVLGPLRLLLDGEEVDLPGPKRRALIALLALADGRAVPIEELLDELWPVGIPRSATATLQSHISRLRRHLGPAGGRLTYQAGAYRLDVGTDVSRARVLLDEARERDDAAACATLREALALWRGVPLAEFAEIRGLAAKAVTLGELRRTIEEALASSALTAAEPHEALELATELAATDPLSESANLLMMRALHVLGRTAEALRVGYEFRIRLLDETGLEPTPALGTLEGELASSTPKRTGAVPRPRDRLRGREAEVTALRRLLDEERLVTVVGPGGVGKTRLAIEVAATVEPATALLLAPITDPSTIPHALASTLDLQVVQGDVLAACAALLQAGPRLLLVDNCEHLAGGVHSVIARLLDDCPDLTVLATSRQPLGLPEEQQFRIAPLALSPPRDLDDIADSPAVAVFVDRARRVRHDYRPTPADLALITRIVRRLEGLPLAIELAAARLSALGLDDLHARLDQALDVLVSRGGESLRETIAWSYDLLPPDEQRLFRYLSVFPDGLEASAAETVAEGLNLATADMAALSNLVDASMLDVTHRATTRFRMLDPVRSFARDQLAEHGELDAATERFVHWALAASARAERLARGPEEAVADSLLRGEITNLRSAWRLLLDAERVDQAVAFLRPLAEMAGWRDLTEVWEWTLELADHPALDAHEDAATMLGRAAGSAWSRGELERAERLARSGLGKRTDSECLVALALVALSRGEFDAAARYGAEAGGHPPVAEYGSGIAALAAAYQGDLDRARHFSKRLEEAATSPTVRAFHAYVTAEISALSEDLAGAVLHYQRAIDLARAVGSTFVEGVAAVGMRSIEASGGQTARALAGYRDLIDYWERTGAWIQQWTTLRNLAELLAAVGEAETAAFLHRSADGSPDAPPWSSRSEHRQRARAKSTERAAEAPASRDAVLAEARAAIERSLTRLGNQV